VSRTPYPRGYTPVSSRAQHHADSSSRKGSRERRRGGRRRGRTPGPGGPTPCSRRVRAPARFTFQEGRSSRAAAGGPDPHAPEGALRFQDAAGPCPVPLPCFIERKRVDSNHRPKEARAAFQAAPTPGRFRFRGRPASALARARGVARPPGSSPMSGEPAARRVDRRVAVVPISPSPAGPGSRRPGRRRRRSTPPTPSAPI
jgi:hypothetical protein